VTREDYNQAAGIALLVALGGILLLITAVVLA
jgi:hypothetical protein